MHVAVAHAKCWSSCARKRAVCPAIPDRELSALQQILHETQSLTFIVPIITQKAAEPRPADERGQGNPGEEGGRAAASGAQADPAAISQPGRPSLHPGPPSVRVRDSPEELGELSDRIGQLCNVTASGLWYHQHGTTCAGSSSPATMQLNIRQADPQQLLFLTRSRFRGISKAHDKKARQNGVNTKTTA